MAPRHLVSLTDWTDEEIQGLLEEAHRFATVGPAGEGDGRVICTAFFEASTRTRLSFETAAHRLGARVSGFSEATSTSTQKGESLEDTMRILGGYADLVVLRHPEIGAAARAAAVSPVPVVNAGDGAGEHPTQALLDLYTLWREFGDLEGRKIAFVGDLRHGRTVHSLAPVLRRFGAEVVQVPAPGLAWDGASMATMNLEDAARTSDALYVTRLQAERFSDEEALQQADGHLRIDRALLERTGSKAIILHPLPRVDELNADVDAMPAAKYFDQAKNGVPVRMAVLAQLLKEPA